MKNAMKLTYDNPMDLSLQKTFNGSLTSTDSTVGLALDLWPSLFHSKFRDP